MKLGDLINLRTLGVIIPGHSEAVVMMIEILYLEHKYRIKAMPI